MKIEDLFCVCAKCEFPDAQVARHPRRESVAALRAILAAAVQDDDFLLDCAAAELTHIEQTPLRRGLAPFYVDPRFGVRLAFGYWAPGSTPGPHEHTAWTITAVVRNQLEVVTFDREASYRRRTLVSKNRFIAEAGQVGYVYDPIIHAPKNVSSDWSLSLHAISPRDGEPPGDFSETVPELTGAGPAAGEHEHPYRYVRNAWHRQNHLRELARLIATLRGPEAPLLLARCALLANAATRRRIRALAKTVGYEAEIPTSPLFVRTHADLKIGFRENGEALTLTSLTESGEQDEFTISATARDAIAFVADQQRFDARFLPGDLSLDERIFVAEALENAGLFREERL
jgi:hypothetical protein